MPADSDAALETLFLPFLTERLAWPHGGVLFLRARAGAPLQQRQWPGLVCEQTFKPDADALTRIGLKLRAPDETTRYPLVLVLTPRQREESRALLARAVELCAAGGRVMAAAANDEGARSAESDLAELVGGVETLSKNKCRVFWSRPLADQVNTARVEAWRSLDAPRPIAEGRFVSRPGVFAWDRIDTASALLAQHLPNDLRGDAADLGAGFGYLSAELLARAPAIRSLDVYEAEQRALDLARTNLASHSGREINFIWHDITQGLQRSYDVIVSNPPFHGSTGRERPDLGRRFIRVAAQALKPAGRLWLVANRHLPYEDVLDRSFGEVRIVTQSSGFKIIEARRNSR